ncbi:MAG: GIY-YIG nuclease family protein [Planctomycetales bacterium]|nr:GIY-YIG nuclease family protein [Planctomycetales bacterium]
MSFFVYVLQNPQGKFYTGQTQDLHLRVAQHNDQSSATSKFAPKNGPWTLVWSEEHSDRASAMRREMQIKAMKSARWIREQLLGEQS